MIYLMIGLSAYAAGIATIILVAVIVDMIQTRNYKKHLHDNANKFIRKDQKK